MSDEIYQVLNGLDICVAYFVIQLGRCALLSFAVLGAVLLVRTFILKDKVFLKGMIWSVFLVVPFFGKLKVFYSNAIVTMPFLWWQELCLKYVWIRYGYLMGMVISAIWFCVRHRRSSKVFKALKAETVGGREVFISKLPVSPFSTGIIKPKIIIPSVMKEQFEKKELDTILLHEKTHIRLGHIWIFALWKLLAVLLWINPFLMKCMPRLKDDMEAICDNVTIHRSTMGATGYGKLVIKSMALLKEEMDEAVTFAGEKDYRSARERIKNIRDFKPYKRNHIFVYALCGMIALSSLVVLTAKLSYPRYTEWMDVTVIDEDNQVVVAQGNEDTFRDVLTFGEREVEINNKAFFKMIGKNDTEQKIYYIYWGGFMKLPGIGGAMNGIFVEEFAEGEKTYVTYKNVENSFIIKLIQWI